MGRRRRGSVDDISGVTREKLNRVSIALMAHVRKLLELNGRTALVTGGSRGLGLQIAEALGEMGARVAITARKKDELDVAVSQLKEKGIDGIAFVCDIGRREAIPGLVDAVLAKLGKVDILVNNAGATWGAPAEDHPLEAWDKLVNVNMTGAFLLSQAIAKKSMIPARWGRIINVASVAGLMGQDPRFAPTAAYTATKHGVVGLTRQLAAEWGVHGITVNAVCPGFFPSKMTRHTLATVGEKVRDLTPTRRLGNDEDLKGLAVLLASEASRHITGQAIAVDGGAVIV
jgi:gluconate 5-dehydrogenase